MGSLGDAVLSIRHVRKEFGSFTALHDITLDVYDGEFLTIVGPSGSGKTTLIRLLVGMDAPTKGEILINGEVVNDVPANKRPTCMVFQSLALFPHRTVGQNIEFPLKIRGIKPAERRARALAFLDMFSLPHEYYSRRVTQCSGGEQQRVALARALAYDPEILFFDEPLSSLDNQLRKHLERELKNLQRRTKKTFIYITHSLEEAMVMSDRIAILRDGNFVQVGTPEEIYSAPCDEFAAGFMGEVNLFEVLCTASGGMTSVGDVVKVNCKNFGVNRDEHASLMVRPEFIRFLKHDESAEFVVDGTLHERYELGSRIQYQVDIGDNRIVTVEKLREQQFNGPVGDQVRLGWDLSRSYLIRKETA